MSDYIYVAAHLPLYIYHLCSFGWQVVSVWPWPPAREFFGSLVIFICLYPIRVIMAALVPEKKLARRIYKRRKSVPTDHDHQSATTAVSSIFH